MTTTDIIMYGALIGQLIGAVVGVVCVAIMFNRRAKERREKANQQAGVSLTPPAEREPDRPDWHGAPASRPR